jgi:hypothetical protein
MTGFPIMDIMIDMTRGEEYTRLNQSDIDRNLRGRYLSLQMFFSRPGVLYRQSGMEQVLSLDGVLNGRFLLKEGTVIESRENSTQRAGYFIVTGSSPEDVNLQIKKAYEYLKLEDVSDDSLLQFYNRMLFPL